MLSREEYVRLSLEVNLFFHRIMKEHLFFIETSLQPVEKGYITKAKRLKQCFEKLLYETIYYAKGGVSESTLKSNEFVTPYTLKAENVVMKLTGACLNTDITKAELDLVSYPAYRFENWKESIICDINERTIQHLLETIVFQENLLSLQLECNIFITLYPEMLEHDIKEALYYLSILEHLQKRDVPMRTLCEELNFWNSIMSDHALFVDGMLGPSEVELKNTAILTAEKFEQLIEECVNTAEDQILQESIDATSDIKDFKNSATAALLECQIKSVIPVLLADHVLREANHYLRLITTLNENLI